MYNGIVNVYKEKGFTSFDVVAKMRGIFGQKKIGHTGTLDPDATGVLPVCLGNATKICDMLSDRDKEYEAVLLLGVNTDTYDMTGKILEEKSTEKLTNEGIIEVINSFVGHIDQIPPMYSALKVNGQKLYDLARKGITIERKARPVTIYNIDILDISIPEVRFRVSCSKGTYIRSLCYDIGQKLGTGGAMKSLIRTVCCGYSIDEALKLDDLQALKNDGRLDMAVRPADSVFLQYPKYELKEEAVRFLLNGNILIPNNFIDMDEDDFPPLIRVYDKEVFMALYRFNEENNEYKPWKMFLPTKN